jgi:hypothetical protein
MQATNNANHFDIQDRRKLGSRNVLCLILLLQEMLDKQDDMFKTNKILEEELARQKVDINSLSLLSNEPECYMNL